MNHEKIFLVEGWGETGYANLSAFVPFIGQKQPGDLEINESTEGRFTNPASDKKPERITRIK